MFSSMADIKTFCRKLEKMCLKKGVELITNTAITKIVTQDGSVSGIEAVQRCDKVKVINIWVDMFKKMLTYSLHRRFGEYGESSEKNLSLKSDVYVLAVGVESFRFNFNFYISSKHFMY